MSWRLTLMMHSRNIRDVSTVVDLFAKASRALKTHRYRKHSAVRLPAEGNLLVTGDLHDNSSHLDRILQIARLRRSRNNHLLLQELIHGEHLVNGMDYSHRMLAQVAELVLQFPGLVHPIMANHELAQMTNRDCSKGADQRVALFNEGIRDVFGPDWQPVQNAVNDFIAAMPIALVSDSGLFCAHSLPSDAAMRRFDANILNRDLSTLDFMGPGGSAYEMTWGRDYTDKTVRLLAARWKVKLFCLGHQHTETGADLRFGSVIILNSDHHQAKVLPLDLSRLPNPEEALRLARPLSRVAA
jgi:hypothetical protein